MDYVLPIILTWLLIVSPAHRFFRGRTSGNPSYRKIYLVFRNLDSAFCFSVACCSIGYLFGIPHIQSFIVTFFVYYGASAIASRTTRRSCKPVFLNGTPGIGNEDWLNFFPSKQRSVVQEIYANTTAEERSRLALIVGELVGRPSYWMSLEIGFVALVLGLPFLPLHWMCIVCGVFLSAFFFLHQKNIYFTQHRLLKELHQSSWAITERNKQKKALLPKLGKCPSC